MAVALVVGVLLAVKLRLGWVEDLPGPFVVEPPMGSPVVVTSSVGNEALMSSEEVIRGLGRDVTMPETGKVELVL